MANEALTATDFLEIGIAALSDATHLVAVGELSPPLRIEISEVDGAVFYSAKFDRSGPAPTLRGENVENVPRVSATLSF